MGLGLLLALLWLLPQIGPKRMENSSQAGSLAVIRWTQSMNRSAGAEAGAWTLVIGGQLTESSGMSGGKHSLSGVALQNGTGQDWSVVTFHLVVYRYGGEESMRATAQARAVRQGDTVELAFVFPGYFRSGDYLELAAEGIPLDG